MALRSFHYRWEFDLESSPEQLWPLIADPNRFNRDTGVPAVQMVQDSKLKNARRHLGLSAFGIPVEWEEQPFEWVRPHRFGVIRRYSKGPMSELLVRVELRARATDERNGPSTTGSKLIYEVSATPKNVIGLLAIPIQIGLISARNFARTIREYDKMAKHGRTAANESKQVEFASGGRDRLLALSEKLVALGSDEELVALLVDHIENADEFSVARMRPYELARRWNQPPRALLSTCLFAAELPVAKHSQLKFENATGEEQLFILERTAWSDEAATAAEVTALQVFRDLFAREALRPGEQISVGTLTVLFTDLKNSTRLYREIGDATAFGQVMNHFDVLKELVADEDGALVKTIGDAVMAVFRQPVAALKSMMKAQQRLAFPADGTQPLMLKAGIHVGPCIAVTLNDRLDYFGSTVNLAARLEGQSNGNDVVISKAVYSDPEVRELLNESANGFAASRFEIPLKGFDEECFELWR